MSTALKENRVRLLLGVKDDKYQQVYTRFFGREKPKRDDLFVKSLNADYGEFRADFDPNDLNLKRWEPGLVHQQKLQRSPWATCLLTGYKITGQAVYLQSGPNLS